MKSIRNWLGRMLRPTITLLFLCVGTCGAYGSVSHCPKHSYDPDGADVYVKVVSAELIDRGDKDPQKDAYRVEVSIEVVGGANRLGYLVGYNIIAVYFDDSSHIIREPQDGDQVHVDAPGYQTDSRTTVVIPHQKYVQKRDGRLTWPKFEIEKITCE